MATKLLINLRPKTLNDIPVSIPYNVLSDDPHVTDINAVLEEFGTDWKDISGNITINKNNTLITDEGDLIFIYPDKVWYAVGCEPDEFTILMEQEVEDTLA